MLPRTPNTDWYDELREDINFRDGVTLKISALTLTKIDGSVLQEMFTEGYERLSRDDKGKIMLPYDYVVFKEILAYLDKDRMVLPAEERLREATIAMI